jgi:hypothetical protein
MEVNRRALNEMSDSMWFTTRKEIEYLNSVDPKTVGNRRLVEELSRRLDALRRYDQHYSDADWRPAQIRSKHAVTAECTLINQIPRIFEKNGSFD